MVFIASSLLLANNTPNNELFLRNTLFVGSALLFHQIVYSQEIQRKTKQKETSAQKSGQGEVAIYWRLERKLFTTV